MAVSEEEDLATGEFPAVFVQDMSNVALVEAALSPCNIVPLAVDVAVIPRVVVALADIAAAAAVVVVVVLPIVAGLLSVPVALGYLHLVLLAHAGAAHLISKVLL